MGLMEKLKAKVINDVLQSGLDKVGAAGMTPKEAVSIFKDSRVVTNEVFDGITLDEVSAITHHVTSQGTWWKKAIAVVGVIVALVAGYMGGNVAPVVDPLTTVAKTVAADMVLSKADKDTATDWVQKYACSDGNCTIMAVTMGVDGIISVNMIDGDLPVIVEVPMVDE